MKKILLSVAFVLVYNVISFAQCNNKLAITASKTEYLSVDSAVERSVEENTMIEISKPTIIIKPGDKKMTAIIKSELCSWKIPFIEGNTIFEVTFDDDQGNSMNATIKIEGIDGKLTLSVQTEGRAGTIRVPIDKFEQKD